MALLTIEYAFMFDRAVAAPVANGREPVMDDGLRAGPVCQDNRLQGRDPGQPTGRDGAVGCPDGLGDRYVMGVPGKAHVDPVHCLPELGEGGVEIEVDTNRDILEC